MVHMYHNGGCHGNTSLIPAGCTGSRRLGKGGGRGGGGLERWWEGGREGWGRHWGGVYIADTVGYLTVVIDLVVVVTRVNLDPGRTRKPNYHSSVCPQNTHRERYWSPELMYIMCIYSLLDLTTYTQYVWIQPRRVPPYWFFLCVFLICNFKMIGYYFDTFLIR